MDRGNLLPVTLGEHFGRLSGGRGLLGGVSEKGAASMSILEDIRAFVPGCEQEQRDREASTSISGGS